METITKRAPKHNNTASSNDVVVNSPLDWALTYINAGFAVLPIKAGEKTPAGGMGVTHATKDTKAAEKWFGETWPEGNIAIATGANSGIIVLDLDAKHGGYDSLKTLPALPETLTAKTGGGGKHFVLNHPGYPVGNSTSKIGSGLDIKGENGYIVVAPSVHPSGNEYEWENWGAKIADSPAWLLEALTASPGKENSNPGEELAIAEGGRNDTLFREACGLRAKGWKEESILKAIEELNKQQCDPPLPPDELRQIVANACKYEPDANQAVVIGGKLYSATDVGNAKQLIKRHGENIRYCPERKSWFIWNGKVWLEDNTREVDRRFIDTMENLDPSDFFEEIPGAKDLQKFANHKKQSLNRGKISAGTEVASILEETLIANGKLDQHPNSLNLNNGTLDLETGILRSHTKEDFLTKILSYEYDEKAACPRFEQFMDDIMLGNQDMVRYMQKLMGYCLSGSTKEECLFIFHGDGSNGKSTLIELQRNLMGSYAKATAFTTFVNTRSDRIRNDIAALVGARFVSAVEVEENSSLDEATVKQLTGSDTISVRMLYKEFFEYKPQFKIALSVNRLPKIKGSDEGIWRRIRVIPFEACFEKNPNKDPDMLKKLQQELPGILNWALAGYALWKQERMGRPDKVDLATSSYRKKMDTLSCFIEECCEVGQDKQVKCSTLHDDYQSWCSTNGFKYLNRSETIDALVSKGFHTKKVKGDNYYKGIAVLKPY